MAIFVHKSSIIDKGAEIGDDTKVWHFCHVLGTARIGRACSLGQNVYVGHATLGNGVRVQNNVSIYDGVEIEDLVFCGPSCVFTNVRNPRAHVTRKDEYLRTRVGKGATIGANATIVCGVTIGAFAFIAAGAVVTKDIPPYGLVVGVPAKRTGWMCECGERLPSRTAHPKCPRCKSAYAVTASACKPL